MTPTQARQITLKEIIDYCKAKQESEYVGDSFFEDGILKQHLDPEFHALQDVINKCNELMNSISIAA